MHRGGVWSAETDLFPIYLMNRDQIVPMDRYFTICSPFIHDFDTIYCSFFLFWVTPSAVLPAKQSLKCVCVGYYSAGAGAAV